MDTQTCVNVPMKRQVSPVSAATALAEPSKQWLRNAWRYTRKVLKRVAPLLIAGFVYPPIAIVYLATGVYEVLRHGRDLATISHQYFLGNGGLTWFLSPLNTLIDILCLPFVNKKIYKLADFPNAYQDEILQVTTACPAEAIIAEVQRRRHADKRTLMIYKWYGFNNRAADCTLFQKKFKYVLTIAVSTFSAQTKTSRHFGWLRAGVRVLYNIGPAPGDGAFIIVNGTRHTWCQDGPLFIFDDTVIHQSFNLTDMERHCLFIDVVRPSYVPVLLRNFVKLLGFVWTRLPFLSKTSNWRLI
jgi:Aspartyl/Asparaginyl beta-hydroxylase